MNRVKILATLNLITFVIACAVSNLSQLKLFNNQDNAQVSAKYDSLFTPAGFTFAIWGVIYIALFVFTIYHVLKAYNEDIKHEANENTLKINQWFIANQIATTIWVFAFTYEYIFLSAILLVFQLITLTVIFIKLNMFDQHASSSSVWFTQFPLSIYFGWICIASIANISLFLVSISWNGFGISPINWSIILILLSIMLSVYLVFVKRNSFVGAVFIWALYGIQFKRASINADLYSYNILIAWIGIGLIALMIIFNTIRNFKSSR